MFKFLENLEKKNQQHRKDKENQWTWKEKENQQMCSQPCKNAGAKLIYSSHEGVRPCDSRITLVCCNPFVVDNGRFVIL